MTFCLCVCVHVCVCVHMHAHADGDQFSGDTQGLGRARSIQDLGRYASWMRHRPTLDPRRGCQAVGACQACKREVAEGWPRQVDLPGHLEASCKPGGEGSGQSLAQPGRQSGGLALGSSEALVSTLSFCFSSLFTSLVIQVTQMIQVLKSVLSFGTHVSLYILKTNFSILKMH